MDTATVLEEAADLLLMRGVERGGGYGMPGAARCVIGAIGEVAGLSDDRLACWDEAAHALRAHLQTVPGQIVMLTSWSDSSADDFEVVDALRLCAKGLRNKATT